MAKLPEKTTVKLTIQRYFNCKRHEILKLSRREQLDLARDAADLLGWILKDEGDYLETYSA